MSKISTEISNGLKHRFSCFIGDTDSVEKSDQQKAARAVKCPIKCFTPELFPENLPELIDHGVDELDVLYEHFAFLLEDHEYDHADAHTQYEQLKVLHKDFNKMSNNDFWACMITKAPYKDIYKHILQYVKIMQTIPITAAECECVVSTVNRMKSDERSRLSTSTLDNLMRIVRDGKSIDDFDPSAPVKRWLSLGSKPRKCTYTVWPHAD